MGKRNMLHFSAELHTRAPPFVGGVEVTAGVSQLIQILCPALQQFFLLVWLINYILDMKVQLKLGS